MLTFFVIILTARIIYAPLDVSFMRSYISDALSYPEQGIHVDIQDLSLNWSQDETSVFLQTSHAEVLDTHKQPIMSFDKIAFSPSWRHLLTAQFKPRSLNIDAPHIRIKRDNSGQFYLGLTDQIDESENSAPSASKNTSSNTNAISSSSKQNDILTHILASLRGDQNTNASNPLSALHLVQINKAELYVQDDLLQSDWNVPSATIRLQRTKNAGFTAQANLTLSPFADIMEKTINVDLQVPTNTQHAIEAALVLNNVPLSMISEKLPMFQSASILDLNVSGQSAIALSHDLQRITHAQINLSANEGNIIHNALDSRLIPLQDLSLKAYYEHNKALELQTLSMLFDGLPITASASITPQQNLQAYLTFKRLEQADFQRLWPKDLHYIGAYDWLANKISQGHFDNVTLTTDLDINPKDAPEPITLNALNANFNFENMQINYRDPLTAITQAKGRGSFDYISEILRVHLQGAKIDTLNVSSADIELAHIVESKHGWADIYLSLDGALADIFTYLEHEPITFKHGYNLNKVQGDAKLKASIQMPVFGDITMDDADIDVRGNITQATLPQLLKGNDLSAIDARLILDGDDISVRGQGVFAQTPLEFDYTSFLSHGDNKPFKEKITIKSNATPSARQALGIDLSAFMQGAPFINATYINKANNQQNITLNTDLAGARLFVDPLGYEKPIGQGGAASMTIALKDNEITTITELQANAPSLLISNGHLDFAHKGALSGGKAPHVIIGATTGKIDFTASPRNEFTLNADLKTLDLRPLIHGEKDQNAKPINQPALITKIKTQKLLTFQDKAAHEAQIYADITPKGRFKQLELDATVDESALYVRYKPDTNGQRTFRLEADNAGATLSTFGLYQQMRGGTIKIHAQPISGQNDHNLLGMAEIDNFRIVEAPTLAKLLSLASIEGLTDGLANEGIEFSRLESQFNWLYKPQGSILTLENGRTSGAAIGLTFDGMMDQGQGSIDVSGTLIPVTQINGALRSIPLIGDILTGGSGIFAVTYTMKGKAKEPEISINPLSVLAPGIIRRVLFE